MSALGRRLVHSAILRAVLLGGGLFHALPAGALEVHGLVDLRLGASDARASWTREGLDKSRFDEGSGGLRLGQAFVRIDGDVAHDFNARLVLGAQDDRAGAIDATEAWLGWNPVPTSPWKVRARAGAFFPPSSLEIDYDSIGWTPARTVSASAINAWIGEEIRIQGIEVSAARKGAHAGSAHDFGFAASAFGRNDPAGTLLAWRGWSVGDRITGLFEPIRLADLPVYRPDGPVPDQTRELRVAREIDGRPGYYVAAHYGYGALRVEALRYDNRADPLALRGGQYGWRTRFDHIGARIETSGSFTILAQALRGTTRMGPDAVHLRFDAWYVLASHVVAGGTASARFDRFRARELPSDILPGDPNGEEGRAVALAYAWRVRRAVEVVCEALEVRSRRSARLLAGEARSRAERSVVVALRWWF